MRFLLLWCIAFSLAGCVVSNPGYPARWSPPLQTTDGCGALTGSYVDLGEPADAARFAGRVSLSAYLFRPFNERPDGDTVALAPGPGPVLRVRALKGTAQVGEVTYQGNENKVECGAEGTILQAYGGVTRGKTNPLVGYQSESVVLQKATDGSLIMKLSSGAFGLVFLLLPAGSSETIWVRFPPASGIAAGS